MSHAIRNTLILLLVLLFIAGSGYAYIHFIQKAEIERLEGSVSTLEQEYAQKSETAELVPLLREQYEAASAFIDGFDKTIFRNSNPDEVFRFLSILNEMANVDFNFVFRDSTVTSDYGIIESEITGQGSYRGFVTLINAIENSEPVQKVSNISVAPVGQDGGYQNVNFTFRLSSNYDSQNIFQTVRTPGVGTMETGPFHNPYYPLIRSVEPNVDNLVNVDNSRLVGVSSNQVFIIDQDGTMKTLRPNDRVYLGRLESINARQGNATFRLNRGGIIDVVTLEVQR